MSSAVLPASVLRVLLRTASANVRQYSAAPPPPSAAALGNSDPQPRSSLSLKLRTLGTQVTPLLEDDNLSFSEFLENVVGKRNLEEVSLRNVLNRNPEVQKFVVKLISARENMTRDNVDKTSAGCHPFVNVARHVEKVITQLFDYSSLFFQDEDYPMNPNMPGVLVYLVGKLLAGSKSDLNNKSILKLSQCINYSTAAFQIHRTVQEDRSAAPWNKLATLAGDLLVIETIKNAACLNDNEIFLWVMNAFGEFSLSEFAPRNSLTGRSTDLLTPESVLLSTGFRGVAKLQSQVSSAFPSSPLSLAPFMVQMECLGSTLGQIWMNGSNRGSLLSQEELTATAEDALDIISDTLPQNSDITRLLRDFVYYYASHDLHSRKVQKSSSCYV